MAVNMQFYAEIMVMISLVHSKRSENVILTSGSQRATVILSLKMYIVSGVTILEKITPHKFRQQKLTALFKHKSKSF